MNNEQVQEIFVEDIIPNRFQPRLTFDEKALKELSDSIKLHGVIQPLVLRKVGNKFEIIAGERRYKASCMAGLTKVPAIVREMTDNESAEVALIENIQRRNLSSIEEAQSFKNLLDKGYLTQEELANKLGVTQPTIANKMRLLNLCDEVQNALLNQQISERHARSLLQLSNVDDQKMMLNRIINERLTVKKLDVEIKKFLNGDTEESTEEVNEIKPIENDVVETFNTGDEESQNKQTNIFGMSIEPPTDLEQSAPNLNVGLEENIPPVEFNPFNPFTEQPSEPLQETPQVEDNIDSFNLETFDMFGDTIKEEQPTPNNMDAAAVVPEKNIGMEINLVRDTIKQIEVNGFETELEEYDFEDMYQMIIKIKK